MNTIATKSKAVSRALGTRSDGDSIRRAFSQRLMSAIRVAGLSISTPVQFARKFNDTHLDKPITIQSAQHWLRGGAIPAEDRTIAFATWLNVSHDWLRYGNGPEPHPKEGIRIENLTPDEVLLICDWRKLQPVPKYLVGEMIAALMSCRELDQIPESATQDA